MEKPSLFIGSSTEGLGFARACRSLLEQDAEITMWNEGFFTLGNTVIDQLVKARSRFDFALLVLTPDDLIRSRKGQKFGPRDNVIFELGLFMGDLGRERTFLLHHADVKIPTDLSALITSRYEWPRQDGSHKAAVGASCDEIRRQIGALGVSEAKTEMEIRDIRSRQDRQEAELRSLQVALQGIVTQYELDKLVGLNEEGPFLVDYSDDMNNELQRLQAMGLIQNHEGVGVWTIRNDFRDRDEPFDLQQFFSITEQGREYLNLRTELLNGAPPPE